MKKYFSISTILLLGLLLLSFGACSDDKNDGEVSEEWKRHQAGWEEKIREEVRKGLYTEVKSESRNGSIYWRTSDYINNNMNGDFDKEGPEAIPKTKSTVQKQRESIEETDQVEVRYEGWYYNLKDKKVVFDSTEKAPSGNNASSLITLVNGVVDGFKTALMDMKVGEERIVCMPYKLGYGVYGSGNIPGYTTLFFDIKVLKNITADKETEAENNDN